MSNVRDWQVFSLIMVTVLLTVAAVWSFNGQWAGVTPEYNTYSIQAKAWLDGRVDIPNYKHLELAFYNDKVYVSFPPFPSVVMLPFVLLFGENTPNALINLFFVGLGIFYAYKLARNFINSASVSIFLALFLTFSTNFFFLMQNGWVWFFAQVLSFTFTTMALYFATKQEKNFYLAFFFLALAIGCRPFQMLYGLLLVWLMFQERPTMKSLLAYMLPALMVGMAYALYNYIRFDHLLEFGHNYLPEMTNSQEGQFSLAYVMHNLQSLFLIPSIGVNHIVDYPKFNGFSIFILNPFIVVTVGLVLAYSVAWARNKVTGDRFVPLFISMFLIGIHIFIIAMHITMGGWHFGNRYIIDTFPAWFIMLVFLDSRIPQYRLMYIPFFVYGIVFNSIGTTLFYLK